MKNPYKLFDKFLLRTPVFSVNDFFRFNSESDDKKAVAKLTDDAFFMEALFLASPDLHQQIIDWKKYDNLSPKNEQKLIYAIFKYLSRMTSRSTPFGLFAGINMGIFGDKTQINLQNKEHFTRHTRLDMNYLVALSQDLEKVPEIRKQIKFYTNTSIYHLGKNLRYVEYHYVGTVRMHEIISVENSDLLQALLNAAKNGAYIDTLVNMLVDDEISYEEASDFIDELIDSQLLISELEPSVSGSEFLEHIIAKLQSIDGVDPLLGLLQDLDEQIKELDRGVQNEVSQYQKIKEIADKIGTEYKDKFLLQTDLAIQTKANQLRTNLQADFADTLQFLNIITAKPEETILQRFGKKLHERFENRAVPLSLALDNEIGIPFGNSRNSADINPLIDDLRIPSKSGGNTKKLHWDELRKVLYQKTVQAQKNNDVEIVLHKKDFASQQTDWSDLPYTMSALIKLVKDGAQEKFYLSGINGSSAGNLLGRFCFVDAETHRFTKEIVVKEDALSGDKILAEIVHLPESRVGNILLRPELRTYEIPYLAKSLKPTEYQLDINDLQVVSDHRGKIKLFSKRLDKEVIPRLTNAHNYTKNALPVYHFLALMQTQNLRNGVYFSWGDLKELFDFLPRVNYKNAILSVAKWKITKDEIKKWQTSKNDADLLQMVADWRKSVQAPQHIVFSQGDNKLLFDLTRVLNLKILLDIIKKRPGVFVEEFLFSDDSFVKRNEDYFANELIITFYNNQK